MPAFPALARAALAIALVPSTAAAAEIATSTISVHVQVASRTSLKVSSELLQFDVPDSGVATAAVDFSAGARVAADDGVVLSVEPLSGLSGPGGAADVETSIDFAGEGDGLVAGRLSSSSPVVAGRWHGSGRREGRLLFTMRSNVAGMYRLPVRFVLSAP